MNKKNLIYFLIFGFIFLNACAQYKTTDGVNNNDWSYDLPNNYTIWHVNSEKIVFGRKNSETSISTIVEDYVFQFCYNDQYVCLQCVENKNIDTEMLYYVINTTTDERKGPLSEREFSEYLEDIISDDFTSWIMTVPRPEGAEFE